MRIIEFLASQLDKEVEDYEQKAPRNIFIQNLEFWQLCLECKRLLIDEQLAKEEKNDTNIG